MHRGIYPSFGTLVLGDTCLGQLLALSFAVPPRDHKSLSALFLAATTPGILVVLHLLTGPVDALGLPPYTGHSFTQHTPLSLYPNLTEHYFFLARSVLFFAWECGEQQWWSYVW